MLEIFFLSKKKDFQNVHYEIQKRAYAGVKMSSTAKEYQRYHGQSDIYGNKD